MARPTHLGLKLDIAHSRSNSRSGNTLSPSTWGEANSLSPPVSPGFGALANRNTNKMIGVESVSINNNNHLKHPALSPLKIDDSVSPRSPSPSNNTNNAPSSNPLSPAASPRRSATTSYPVTPMTPRKKCAHSGCSSERFARGYCAGHLTSGFAASTPTSKIRGAYNLWAKSGMNDDTSAKRMWKFADRDYSHTIELAEDLYTGEREILVNKKQAYKGFPELGFWAIDIAIGQSFEKGTNCRIEVYPTMKGYDYELFIEEVKFDAAHANFLSNLSSVQLMQRMGASLDPIREKQQQKLEKEYIKKNWKQMDELEKTKLGYTKTRITWKFTNQGKHHEVVLEHGHFGGKKKIWMDGKVVFEKKPGLLSSKHKYFRHEFPVDNVTCEVIVQKNKRVEIVESKAADSDNEEEEEEEETHACDRPFLYELLVDKVPFDECTRTAMDHAGGDIALDKVIAASIKKSPNDNNKENELVVPSTKGRPGHHGRTPSMITGTQRKSVFASMTDEELAECGAMMASGGEGETTENDESWAKF